MIPDADLDRLPSAIADKYRADPARWEAAALSTLAQRAGKAIARPHQPRCTVLASAVDEWAFVATRTLLEDARRLLPSLINVDLVVGVARSGLLPAGVLAYDLHRPLWSVSPSAGLLDVGHGVRLDGQAREVRRIAVIDDTTARGVAMREASAIVRERFPDAEIVRAVVYAHPHGMGEVDIVVREYPGLHYLEWNWCNAGHGVKCGFDFDGIICHDLEDGPDYVRRITEAPPLYLPRRHPIPLIVTARPESVRTETLDWLDRHGLTCERLVMRDWKWNGCEWDGARVARFKADHFGRSGLPMFAESDPFQAQTIAEITGKVVLCPAAGRVFAPARPSVAEVQAIQTRQRRCPSLTRDGCNCYCSRLERRPDVWTDCRPCPELPSVLASPTDLTPPRGQDSAESDHAPQAEHDRGQRPEKQGRQQRQKEKPAVRRS
jgi:hypoxanthine phosphoribosyltransferase